MDDIKVSLNTKQMAEDMNILIDVCDKSSKSRDKAGRRNPEIFISTGARQIQAQEMAESIGILEKTMERKFKEYSEKAQQLGEDFAKDNSRSFDGKEISSRAKDKKERGHSWSNTYKERYKRWFKTSHSSSGNGYLQKRVKIPLLSFVGLMTHQKILMECGYNNFLPIQKY